MPGGASTLMLTTDSASFLRWCSLFFFSCSVDRDWDSGLRRLVCVPLGINAGGEGVYGKCVYGEWFLSFDINLHLKSQVFHWVMTEWMGFPGGWRSGG